MDAMISECAGLVTVERESNIFRLVHYTTQEHFEHTRDSWFAPANADMARTCLAYLTQGHEFHFESCFNHDSGLTAPSYASNNWADHVRDDSIVQQELPRLLEDQKHIDFLWNSTPGRALNRFRSNRGTALRLVARDGLKGTLESLLENCQAVDLRDY
ncbi:hypothetical protein B0T10DRAFT_459975 [Thelonectria olida]|uniref:Uncharacterized protein n=1 Tax=Thelonectria olida TaxID=1576542 RepID=A0A9P9APS9_9HYPO|nr:hypothetical protein B0T10DRAFT_459975 [Thelonectria olida]